MRLPNDSAVRLPNDSAVRLPNDSAVRLPGESGDRYVIRSVAQDHVPVPRFTGIKKNKIMPIVRDYLIIQNASSLLRIAASDILYIEADGNYCTIFLTDGTKEVVTRKLKEVEQLMMEHFTKYSEFVRIARSYIINLDYVYSIDSTNHKLVLVSPDHTKTNLELSADVLKNLLRQFNVLIAKDTQDKNVRMIYERV